MNKGSISPLRPDGKIGNVTASESCRHLAKGHRMTAEIAVMNKSAVALAVDSAVTIQHEAGQKIYNTVNKLFGISQKCPVGMMIYGSAQLMSVPWETIIRVYQTKLGEKRFNRLSQYADHFFDFLDRRNALFPQSQQDQSFIDTLMSYYRGLVEEIRGEIRKEIERSGAANNAQVRKISASVIKIHFDFWEKSKPLKHFSGNHRSRIWQRYRRKIPKIIKDVFENLPIGRRSLEQLRSMALDVFCKDQFPTNCSGIVIAGFGDKDTFPSVISYEVELVINDRLKFRKLEKSTALDFDTTASVMPFAQADVVITLVEGTDPEYQMLVESHLSKILSFYPEEIVKRLGLNNKRKENQLRKALREFGTKMQEEFSSQLKQFRHEHHVIPLLEVVDVLPKDELAAMAESLVNLTCLKRKMSLGAETVGGPIDVAVISKGDGLIWIKRKHYFTKDLNPHFFLRYSTTGKI